MEINFINHDDFKKHVQNTINSYSQNLESVDINKFNRNIIDPIKLTFDCKILNKSIVSIVEEEIGRQKDKSNNNFIGYFHQNIFKYIKNCTVPQTGWDVIYSNGSNKIVVELKNKHNTMNDSSSRDTYLKMKNYLDRNPQDQCFLVEVIASKSQNITWEKLINKEKYHDDRIRRVSIDKFYSIITGDDEAFLKLCKSIPLVIDEILQYKPFQEEISDTVFEGLINIDKDISRALYLLAFKTYDGFSNF